MTRRSSSPQASRPWRLPVVGLLALAVSGVMSLPAAAAAPPLGYQAIPLVPVTGQAFEASRTGNPITSTGRVAGTARPTPESDVHAAAVFYLGNHTIRVLHPPGSSGSSAVDVNNLGQVAGSAEYPGRPRQAFVWTSRTGTYRVLPLPPGASSAYPYALNDHGAVVGYYTDADNHYRAFVSDPAVDDGRIRNLGTIGTDDYAVGTGINNAGDVIGYTFSLTRQGTRGFLWQSRTGAMTSLGRPAGTNTMVPNDINDSGVIVGSAAYVPPVDREQDYRPGRGWVLSPVTGQFRELPAANSADPAAEGTADAINAHGIIVGGSYSAGTWSAVLWNACGTAKQVLAAHDDVTYASGINRYERVLGVDALAPVLWRRNNGPCVLQ
ncbi:hypothetical protein [uncultured Friedmanniella sp.]|uniref:hypothetical protein n=1 Tax=uncultured Friedmanniella sp. TaxID=335381 RepID=UPI0035CA88D3